LNSPKTYLLGIDVGTTGAKSVIFDVNGQLISRGYKEYPMIAPQSRWAEQDPNDWWTATIEGIKMAVKKASIAEDKIACIGLSGQTNSPSFLDKDGTPIRPSILWIDLRSEPQVAWVRKRVGEEAIHKTTGVKVNSFYSFVKIMWVKQNEPEKYERTKVILQPKDFIGFKLTDEYFLDKALASSSGFLDIKQEKYATDLLGEMGLSIEKLPKLVQSTDVVGNVTGKAAEITGLRKGTPVVAGSGDVMVNAVGSGVTKSGRAYNKTATASDSVVCVDHPIFDPKIRMVSYLHTLPNKWLLVGGTSGGICYRWFRDKFAQPEIETAKRLNQDPYELMNAEAQQVPPGSENLIFLPYLAGVRSPIWDPNARGVFFGISLNHDKRHFTRAIMEGIAYSVRHRIEIIEKEFDVKIEDVRAVGGGARSRLWLNIMADVYRKPIVMLGGEEQECLGAAILAGTGIGLYRDATEASDKLVTITDKLEPNKKNIEKYERLFKLYVDLYERLKDSFETLSQS